MSDNFRVVECLYTPSELYCIYDYTKIAYLVGNYICIREVVSPEVSPNFIKLDSGLDQKNQQKYIALLSYPNLLILAQKSASRDIYLTFYSVNQENQMKINSELARKADSEQDLSYQFHQSSNNIYLIVHRDNDSQIIVVSASRREVISRGFVSGEMTEFKIKSLEDAQLFSFLHPQTKEIVQYELIGSKAEEPLFRLAQRNRCILAAKVVSVAWCKEQLVVAYDHKVTVYLEGKELHNIQGLKNVKMIVPIMGGFIAVVAHSMRVYRKSASVYEFEGDYSLEQTPSTVLRLSPQEDLLAYYSDKAKAIYWRLNWEPEQSSTKHHELALSKIQMPKQQEIRAYPSNQSLFAITSGSHLSIYSPITYHCYLSMGASKRQALKSLDKKRLLRSTTLVSGKMLNEISEGQPIECLSIHPTKPLVSVAYKNVVRIYLVLYNQFKMQKEIALAHCKGISFNNSGNIICARLGGKQGSKIYLYNVLNNFQCIEIVNTSRPVLDIKWTPYDTVMYAVHANGYYTWTLDSLFKHKQESSYKFDFSIRGAEMLSSSVIFWGDERVVELDFNNEVLDSIKLKNQIESLLVQKGHIIFTSSAGDLYRCKGISQMVETMQSPGFKITPRSKLYAVRTNTILSMNSDGNILCLEWGNDEKSSQLVSIQRKKLVKFQQAYQGYEQQIKDTNEKMEVQLEMLRQQFAKREQQQRQYFSRELIDREQRYREIREEKFRMEEQMQETMEIQEQDVLKQIKELERIYQRKIALTTNKLLTSDQIAFRNNMLAKENLIELEQKHAEGITKVRNQYGKALEKEAGFRFGVKEEILAMKRDYETRLSELEIQNEELLKRFQNLNEANIVNLKKNVVNLELKYSQAISQKYNLQKNFENERISIQQLHAKNDYLSERLEEQVRRGQELSKQNSKMQEVLIVKDESITCLQARIAELQKSNQIFKYRIIQIKNISDPKEEEILKLKDNMVELEEQYDKMSKKAHQLEQTLALVRKDNIQLKNSLGNITNKERRLDKNYAMLTDKLREITKAPIQEIRKSLLKLLEQFERHADINTGTTEVYQDGPLEELNRVREHLEVCLKEAVDAGKKNEKQKQTQVKRRNKENSELLREINDLRIKVHMLEEKLKDRELQLQEVKRQKRLHSSSVTKPQKQPSSTHIDTEVERNHTRESFFEKSLFRGHWKDKRLRTEQGSRKKSNLSHIRNETNHLYIESKQEQVEELKRVLQQKQVIIKQLINKIHKLS